MYTPVKINGGAAVNVFTGQRSRSHMSLKLRSD